MKIFDNIMSWKKPEMLDLAKELNIKYVCQGIHYKVDYLKDFARNKALLAENIAYIGDDLNDFPAMHFVGVSACPLDAVDEVKTFCDYVLPVNGGEGCSCICQFIAKINK